MNTNKEIIKPIGLKKGDSIGIFSPSEPLTPERRKRFEKGIKLLESLGYKIVLGENIFNSFYYMAGKPEERVKDFHDLIISPEVKAIMTSWGGRSANQLLSLIDYELVNQHPKIICGFSDSTNLINAIYTITGIVTFHGPNVVGKLAESPSPTIEYFKKAFIKGEIGVVRFKLPSKCLRAGKAEGRLIGGNLTCFDLGLIGTPYQPNFKDTIFFWEAGARTPQEIDQFLTHLKLAGAFDHIKGMLVGYLGECKDDRDWGGRTIEDVILSVTRDCNFPIMMMPAFGHGNIENVTLPIGCRAFLDSENLHFEVTEKCVERV